MSKKAFSPSPFGRYLKECREKEGLSLRGLARLTGISHTFLADVEKGRRPTVGREWWPVLAAAMPTSFTARSAQWFASFSTEVKLDVREMSWAYRELMVSVVRHVERKDLTESQIERMLAILAEDSDSP